MQTIIIYVMFMGELGPWSITYPTYDECHQVEHMILRINEHNNHGPPQKRVRKIYQNGLTGASIAFISCSK